MAQQFHHSSQTHNTQHSSSTIVTYPDSNNKIKNVLVACRSIWSALGDRSSSTTIRSNEVSHRNSSNDDLDNAAKKAYSSASARATDQQANAVIHLMNSSRMPLFCLAVERGRAAYTSCNSSLVACMVSIVRRVLLSPHTTLYLQCIICKLRSIFLEQACA